MKKAILGSLIIVLGCLGLWFLGRPAYHAVAAELALRLKKPGEAIAQFAQASRLESTILLSPKDATCGGEESMFWKTSSRS